MSNNKQWRFDGSLLAVLYLLGRYITYFAAVGGSLYGSGDLERYFEIASLKGVPFFSYWVEYPPVFPLLNFLVFHWAGGNHFFYDIILFFLLALMGSACVFLFYKIALELWGVETGLTRSILYLVILLPLPYTWWYYETIPVFMMLIALWLANRRKPVSTGIWIGLGIMTKWFPAMLLPAIWRFKNRRDALTISILALMLTGLVIGALWIASPEMTSASLASQPGRNSWQTVWAWLDGNFMHGAIASPEDRYAPDFVLNGLRGNPPVISPWIRLIVFGLAGLFLFWKVKIKNYHSMVSFIGITWAVFLLWSSGWSPQWILYLVPLVLLTFPIQKALIWNSLLILLTVIEWPFLLGHTLFEFMGPIALVRSVLLIIFTVIWFRFTQVDIGINENS